MNNSNKKNYLDFEYYCVNKHYLDFNQKTYHWSLIPDTVLIDSGYFENEELLRERRKKNKGILKEYGLDAISIENLNDIFIYHGIQVKLWNETICAKHLGTFTSVIINRFSDQSKGYLYYTSQLESTFDNDIKRKNKFIAIKVDNPYEENYKIENSNKLILRDYQIEAVNKLNTNWDGIKTLILPCGTGKTIVFSEYLKQNNFQNIFIFSPLTVLTEQNLERVSKYLINYNSLLIDVNGTRDFKEIENNLHKNYIFSSTFCSAKSVISQLFLKDYNLNSKNTILIVDEAHNLLNQKFLIEIINKFPKVLLVTATLPIQMEETIPNEIIYHYPFRKAIENNYICDYEIYLPFYENGEINIKLPSELYELKILGKNICEKCLFFINGLLRTGKRRSIVYLYSKEECELYSYVLKEIMDKYHFYDILIYEITSNTSKKDRIEILYNFEKEEIYEVLKVILSIRILDEGIDIVKCDSIFITNVGDQNNDIRYLQRICRANRLDSNNIHKKASIFIWCEDKNKILNTLQMLKINDINLNKKVKVHNSNYGLYKKGESIKNIEINNEIVDFININCLTEEELWEKKKELLFEFCNLNKRCINKNENYKNHNIGNWYYSQKIKILSNFKIHKNLYDKLLFNKYVKKNIRQRDINSHLTYQCKRCNNYITERKSNMKNHLERKNKCEKSINSYSLTDEEILNKSLIKYNNNIKNNNKNCLIDKLSNNEENNKKNINLSNNINHNTYTNIIVNSNIENFNINLIKPLPFDKEWNLDNLDYKDKKDIITTKSMFTVLLENILKNELNLNVVIGNDSNSGLVYINDNEKYVKMNHQDILEKSMEKLYNHINEMIELLKNNTQEEIIEILNKSNEKKYNNYKENSTLKKRVNELLYDIFLLSKDKAVDVMNSFQKNNINEKLEY